MQEGVTNQVNDSWGVFRKALVESIAAIDREYFSVDRYAATPTWRQRVYCYELYHNLRCALGNGFPYVLHGEIDKRGHAWVKSVLGYEPNPDFVVHAAGTQGGLAVVEVEPADCDVGAATEDVKKLRDFVTEVDYHTGILLLVGRVPVKRQVRSLIAEIERQEPRLLILHHAAAATKPQVLVESDDSPDDDE